MEMYRFELLRSLDHLLFILFVLSYLLSPSNLLPLLLRLVTQVQFATPLSLDPAKPLRFFLAIWAVFNSSFILVHLRGAGGTKGDNWSGRGVVLDFIGQGVTPSVGRLLVLDVMIAMVQFVCIVIGFELDAGRRINGTVLVCLRENEEAESSGDEMWCDGESRLVEQPIIEIRFRSIWNQVLRPEPTEQDIRGMEEGRITTA